MDSQFIERVALVSALKAGAATTFETKDKTREHLDPGWYGDDLARSRPGYP
jgi:hypothetical protein